MRVSIGCLLAVAFAPSSAFALDGAVVEDHSGDPVVSARIRVRAPNGEIVADRDSDRSGRFTTPKLDPGSYRIEVAKPNYLSAWLEIDDPASPVEIRLARLGVISGRVLDGAQQPIHRAFVFPLARSEGRWRPLNRILTDRSGRYRLHGLAPGRYGVAVSRSNYQYRSTSGAGATFYPSNSDPREFEIASGEEYDNIDFMMAFGAGQAVSGRVEGADSERRFAIALADRSRPILAVASTATDDDGAFELEAVPPGSYFLLASGPTGGHSFRGAIFREERFFARTEIDVVGYDVRDLRLDVEPALRGSVRVELGSREASRFCPTTVDLSLTGAEDWAAEIRRQAKARVGESVPVDELAPAPYLVEAAKLPPGCFQVGETLLDPRNDSEPALVRLDAAARVEGRLIGATGVSAVVVLLPSQPHSQATSPLLSTRPDESGRFSFDDLRPGSYRILARREASPKARWSPGGGEAFLLEAVGGTATEIDLPAPGRDGSR